MDLTSGLFQEEVERDDFVGPEAVIVLGGDGTLTSIAHSVDDQTLVMGVNSHLWTAEEAGLSDSSWEATQLGFPRIWIIS